MLFLMIILAAIFDADSNRYKGNNTYYTKKRRYNRTTGNKYWEDAHYWHLNYGD